MQYTCPSCGAAIQFKSRFSAMTLCSYCQSMLVRENDLLLQKGKMAALAKDMSILQIGTKGNYLKQSFEIIGQLKVTWIDGYWNEWYVLEDSGNIAWIAEALGYFSYIHEITLPTPPTADTLEIGQTLILDERIFTISDIKSYVIAGCMGELPFEIQSGQTGLSVDCLSPESHCAYLDYMQKSTRAYTGRFVEIEELQLTNMRAIDDW